MNEDARPLTAEDLALLRRGGLFPAEIGTALADEYERRLFQSPLLNMVDSAVAGGACVAQPPEDRCDWQAGECHCGAYPRVASMPEALARARQSRLARDESQTSTGVDDLPADRAANDPAPQASAPTDLATSTPDRAVDVAGTTGPTP